MDPDELAKLYERRKAERAASTAKVLALLEANQQAVQAEREQQAQWGQTALRDVVIPYFRELEATFPNAEFKLDPAATLDAESHLPVAVAFQIGDGPKHVIEVVEGHVRIYFVPRDDKDGPAILEFVYSGDAEPFIAGPLDLTREKLGKLIEIAIEQR